MNWGVLWTSRHQLSDGFLVTVQVSTVSLILSMGLAIVIVLAFQLGIKLVRLVIRSYIEFMQNVPPVIHVLFIFYALPGMGLRLSALQAGTLGLTVYSSAFIAEALHSGIRAIDRGQWDAVRSSGLSYIQAMRLVIFPQALVYALPALTNQWIRLVKNTSILVVIAGSDLMYQAVNLAQLTFAVFEIFIAVWVAYLVITIPISRVAYAAENAIKWRRHHSMRAAIGPVPYA